MQEYVYEARTPIMGHHADTLPFTLQRPPHTPGPQSPSSAGAGAEPWLRRQTIPLPPTPDMMPRGVPHSVTAVSILTSSAPTDNEDLDDVDFGCPDSGVQVTRAASSHLRSPTVALTPGAVTLPADVSDSSTFGLTSTFRPGCRRGADYSHGGGVATMGRTRSASLRRFPMVGELAVFGGPCSVGGMGHRDAPYYFKLDPSVLERDHVVRPDVLRGCTCSRTAATPLLR